MNYLRAARLRPGAREARARARQSEARLSALGWEYARAWAPPRRPVDRQQLRVRSRWARVCGHLVRIARIKTWYEAQWVARCKEHLKVDMAAHVWCEEHALRENMAVKLFPNRLATMDLVFLHLNAVTQPAPEPPPVRVGIIVEYADTGEDTDFELLCGLCQSLQLPASERRRWGRHEIRRIDCGSYRQHLYHMVASTENDWVRGLQGVVTPACDPAAPAAEQLRAQVVEVHYEKYVHQNVATAWWLELFLNGMLATPTTRQTAQMRQWVMAVYSATCSAVLANRWLDRAPGGSHQGVALPKSVRSAHGKRAQVANAFMARTQREYALYERQIPVEERFKTMCLYCM